MTPAKKARVCSMSFSASRPTNVTKCSDFCNQEQASNGCDIVAKLGFINTKPNSYLPKRGQQPKIQNCRVHHYCHKLMNKMEVAEQNKQTAMYKNINKTP